MLPPLELDQAITQVVREEWGRILASLTQALGDIQLAEDALQDATETALRKWPEHGLPSSPAAWLIQTARRRAIDRIRRANNFQSKSEDIAYLAALEQQVDEGDAESELIPDKRLEMIFTCCHPSLEQKTQIALTLRTLGGLTTEEIATAFLDKPAAMAKRLARAKQKIKAANIPYQVPAEQDLPERLSAVLTVIYLVFNEGYSASSGASLLRANLCDEAIRLARILRQLLPMETEVTGLLALMLLHESRKRARLDADGHLVPLELQARSSWDRLKIEEGAELVKQALSQQRLGPYQLQAAISALHSEAPSWGETDWQQIYALYVLLDKLAPTPVVKINMALARSYADSIEAGMDLLAAIELTPDLEAYQPYHLAKSDLLQRQGRVDEAIASLEQAILLETNEASVCFLTDKLASLTSG